MFDIEKYMESFKESLSKRFERHEDNFKNLAGKMQSFEVTQSDHKKRLVRLENKKNLGENEDIRFQHVKFFYLVFLLFFICFYFYENQKILGTIQIRKNY